MKEVSPNAIVVLVIIVELLVVLKELMVVGMVPG